MTPGRAFRKLQNAFRRAEPLITVSISKENLLHNLHTYQRQYPGLKFAPVLKSNAYGHGLCVVARLLDREQIAFFMVDSLYEARSLRADGVRSRILVLGYVRPHDIAKNPLKDVDFAITDLEQLRELAEDTRAAARLHLKIDTGMHRQGILPEQLDEAIELVRSNPHLIVTGACSHFADADTTGSAHVQGQIARWQDAVKKVAHAFSTLAYTHIAATKGVAYSAQVDANVARLGIGLYGFDTSPDGSSPVKPVMEMRSLITSLRALPAGESVGYNATYTLTRSSIIATVPVGYFEGIDRALSNKGAMFVHGTPAPLAGRVSMNMSSLDVTDIPDVRQGDKVIAISRNPDDTNCVEAMAEMAGTTPYVILVHVPQHLKRVVE